jgi:hypothetical protein
MYLTQSAADRGRRSNDQGLSPALAEPRPGQHSSRGAKPGLRRVGVVAAVVTMTILLLGVAAPAAHGATPTNSSVEPHALTANPTCVKGSIGESICVYAHATSLEAEFNGFVSFGLSAAVLEASGEHEGDSIDASEELSSFKYDSTVTVPSDYYAGNACVVTVSFTTSVPEPTKLCASFDLFVPGVGGGYRLSGANGKVSGSGNAVEYGSLSTSPTANPVVGIASTPAGKGYWEVTRDGGVARFGDAGNYNDLPGLHVNVHDIVAIAPTSDGKGYWLIGADGGEFAFGDAGYHGSLPGLHIHVDDIVGMVATPNGKGYILVGRDGGVFVFGGVYHGSLPGLHIRVDDIVGILPTGAETGYVLVGSDGGSFVFGTGSGYYGSLPGRKVKVSDIVGIALSPDQHGYWMVGANASVYNFGDATYFGTPAGATSDLPITAISAT